MVGEKGKRTFDRVDWEMLARQFDAGATCHELALKSGYSYDWVRRMVAQCRADDLATRTQVYRTGIYRELVRAEADLIFGDVEAATKKLRALDMLMKLEKDLRQLGDARAAQPEQAEDIAELRAELERRFERLRASGDTERITEVLDRASAESCQP